jgi:hypothetical protein
MYDYQEAPYGTRQGFLYIRVRPCRYDPLHIKSQVSSHVSVYCNSNNSIPELSTRRIAYPSSVGYSAARTVLSLANRNQAVPPGYETRFFNEIGIGFDSHPFKTAMTELLMTPAPDRPIPSQILREDYFQQLDEDDIIERHFTDIFQKSASQKAPRSNPGPEPSFIDPNVYLKDHMIPLMHRMFMNGNMGFPPNVAQAAVALAYTGGEAALIGATIETDASIIQEARKLCAAAPGPRRDLVVQLRNAANQAQPNEAKQAATRRFYQIILTVVRLMVLWQLRRGGLTSILRLRSSRSLNCSRFCLPLSLTRKNCLIRNIEAIL